MITDWLEKIRPFVIKKKNPKKLQKTKKLKILKGFFLSFFLSLSLSLSIYIYIYIYIYLCVLVCVCVCVCVFIQPLQDATQGQFLSRVEMV